jgi:hypothetical protein
VWVDLKAGPERFRGYIEVSARDEDGVPARVRRPVDIPAGQTVFGVSAYVFMGEENAEIGVTPLDEAGRVQGPPKLEQNLESLHRSQSLVLRLGNPSGLEQVGELAKYKDPRGTSGSELRVVRTRVPDGLPGRGQGYDSLEAVVIDTNDRTVLDALAGGAALALRDWVRQGGHLILAVGANWQMVNDGPLAEMLPAELAGQVRLGDPRALEAFAGNPKKKIPEDQPPLVVKMENWAQMGGVALAATTVTPLVVRGSYGFGRVTLIGVNVDQAPFAQWEDRHLFWDKALEIPGHFAGAAAPGLNYGGGQLIQRGSGELGTTLHEELEQFPGVKLVPFGWVAFFVFLYILLIGPGDYFFLRKVVKRMEYTWITFPVIVLAVSLIAYAAAYALKGTELRIKKADVVDIDQASGLARGASYFSLFSPQNRDYEVGLAPIGPSRSGSDSIIAPMDTELPTTTRVTIRAFGRESNDGGGLGLSGRGYRMLPDGESERLAGIRVPIWSTKGFEARWESPAAPVLETSLLRAGPDRLTGTIKNLLDQPLENVFLVSGKQVYPLKTIPAGGTVRVAPSASTSLAAFLEQRAAAVSAIGQRGRGGATTANANPIGSILETAMFHNGLGARAAAVPSTRLRHLDLSSLAVDLHRPILVAEVSRPVSAIKLNWSGSPPKADQLNWLRVVLPPPPDEDTSTAPAPAPTPTASPDATKTP